MNPVIILDPASGPVGTSVNITGAGFGPSSPITIEFDGTPVDTSPSTVTNTPAGFFTATFKVPSSSNGNHTVKATQGANSDSETFTVTSSTVPAISLNPTSGPVGTTVTVTGINFDPSAVVTLQFDGNLVTTNPSTITPNSNGGFSATFTVPASSDGDQMVKSVRCRRLRARVKPSGLGAQQVEHVLKAHPVDRPVVGHAELLHHAPRGHVVGSANATISSRPARSKPQASDPPLPRCAKPSPQRSGSTPSRPRRPARPRPRSRSRPTRPTSSPEAALAPPPQAVAPVL